MDSEALNHQSQPSLGEGHGLSAVERHGPQLARAQTGVEHDPRHVLRVNRDAPMQRPLGLRGAGGACPFLIKSVANARRLR